MKCPRCAIGMISGHTHECNVCGFMPVGQSGDALASLDEATRNALEDYLRPLGLLRRTDRSLVCFAEERETERGILLKVLFPAPTELAQVARRFDRELTEAAALAHPHIIAIRRFGTSTTVCWYAMDQAPGQTVDELTYKTGTLELPETLQIAHQVASALDYMHRRNFVHGNLKPSNIIVDPRGGVRVGDGGIRRVWGMTPPLRAETAPADALAYLAPEHFDARGKIGPGADQYALAAIVFEALIGVPPFRGVSFEDFALAHQSAPPPSIVTLRPDLPPMLGKALQRALAKEPGARFATMAEFAKALALPSQRASPAPNLAMALPAAHQEILLVEPAPPPPAPPRSLWRKVLVGTALVAVAGLVAVMTLRPAAQPEVADEPPAPSDLVSDFSGEPADSLAVAPAHVPPAATPAPVVARPVAPTAPPPASAQLSVNSTPWAVLTIDGKVIGNTPQIGLVLRPGSHQVLLSRDGFLPYTAVVRLSPGETARLTGITLQAAR
ncbi:MAG TPA: serine/threonine-protein kinase [Gemmatimonadales bacterium]|nr:serine/threonine-protein kinase [Gemmatimonadales bacterium]